MSVLFRRAKFAMPNAPTFTIEPIRDWLEDELQLARANLEKIDRSMVIIDPFCGTSGIAEFIYRKYSNQLYLNDLQNGLEASKYLDVLIANGVYGDFFVFDPPYSPRQIAEVYKSVGLKASATDTQSARMKREVRDRIQALSKPGARCVSFGWNSNGQGLTRGWELLDGALFPHGAEHNDTIAIVERRTAGKMIQEW